MSSTPTVSHEVHAAVQDASRAMRPFAQVSDEKRANFLEHISTELEALGDTLLEIAHEETHLPIGRLTGERGRTVGQLRMFANLIRQPKWRGEIVEAADPARLPAPKPALRRTLLPIGPVAVFGASNFPFAFSVPGGDTASALAAGCPVIAKAHPAHSKTSESCAEAIQKAARETGMPSGTFQLVHGEKEVGAALAHHPLMRGIAFTGSQQAGRALFDIAATRPHPIPVFAEMGSVNPVFLFPGALRERNEALAKGFAASLTLGVGQFCTNPGVLIAADGADLDTFLSVLLEELKGLSVGTMLHGGIASTYVAEVKKRSSRKVEVHTSGTAPGEPAVFVTTSDAFLEDESLRSEIFGPAAVIVRCKSINEFEWVAQGMEGQLTATMHFQPSEEPDARALLPTLADLAGRVIGNGWPTGVEVSPAMQHGGPYPATTDSRFTSVGTAAIWRFLRPVCFQDL